MSRCFRATERQPLKGELKVPGDKSISHRAVMLGAIAQGTTTVHGFLYSDDCTHTIQCLKQLGVQIECREREVIIHGNGFEGISEPKHVLYVGNSGTTNRLLTGLLSGFPMYSVIQGDDSIANRPMDRVVKPLRMMGASIDGRANGLYPPLTIKGGNLAGITYETPVASAQVKSAILLAGLQAKGMTTVIEPTLSRDHTERMLTAFGVEVIRDGTSVSVQGNQRLTATEINVPADISSAAFFMVAAAMIEGSDVVLTDVGINPTRAGIIDALIEMGASITLKNERMNFGEPVANIHIKGSKLKNIEIGGEMIPRLIDEIPILALAATQADGTMVIKDAAELKVKETNRIDAVVEQLRCLGATIEATEDGMIIHGKSKLYGGHVDSLGDHRIGMMLAVASLLITEGELILNNESSVSVSYPNFYSDLDTLISNKSFQKK